MTLPNLTAMEKQFIAECRELLNELEATGATCWCDGVQCMLCRLQNDAGSFDDNTIPTCSYPAVLS